MYDKANIQIGAMLQRIRQALIGVVDVFQARFSGRHPAHDFGLIARTKGA